MAVPKSRVPRLGSTIAALAKRLLISAINKGDMGTPKEDSPLVSVVLTTHNAEKTVCPTLESAICQSYPHHEIIIVDDGSTDSTFDLLKGYEVEVIQTNPSGVATARNRGLKAAKGEFVCFLDDDDAWYPEKLALQVAIMRQYPSVGLSFANLELVDTEGRSLGNTFLGREMRFAPSWADLVTFKSVVLPSSVIVRRELATRIGGFDETFVQYGFEDTDFFVRLREIATYHFLNVCLGRRLVEERHPTQYVVNLPYYARKYWHHPRVENSRNASLRHEFVSACNHILIWAMEGLLRLQGNKVSRELLRELNGYHRSFADIFGDSYERVTQFRPIDLDKYNLDSVTSTLLFIFLLRRDLQTYAEVEEGDLYRLVEWAVRVGQGRLMDPAGPVLQPYRQQLERISRLTVSRRRRFLEVIRRVASFALTLQG